MSDVIGLRPGSMLGEAAKPPFAVLPDPAAPFINRSMRLTTLAPAHDLAPYLSFLATLTRAQHDIQQDLALAAPPPFDRIGQSLDHGMAPLAKAQLGPDPAIELTLERCLDRLADADAPPEATTATHVVRSMAPADRRRLTSAVLGDERVGDVKCFWCGSTDGLSYQMIEGKSDTTKAETCEKCRSYVKVLYQVNDHALDPFADDIATLGLDMLMAHAGWQRRGQNAFLLGY
jgi:FdhE protein